MTIPSNHHSLLSMLSSIKSVIKDSYLFYLLVSAVFPSESHLCFSARLHNEGVGFLLCIATVVYKGVFLSCQFTHNGTVCDHGLSGCVLM